MKLSCPNSDCYEDKLGNQVVRHGYFQARYQTRPLRRYRCKQCGKTFSAATFNPCFKQKKRYLNPKIKRMLCSSNSQRRIAKILKCTKNTVARKFHFLAQQARGEFEGSFALEDYLEVQFDEMETFEHTNAKPLSISLMVNRERKILGFQVAKFRPKTKRLAIISEKKYGRRPDERREKLEKLYEKILKKNPQFNPATIKSDMCPFYPKVVKKYFPRTKHETFKGRRAAVVGQGELKEKGFDPLFSLNHTCAMIRYGMSRLVRKTWCTTKKISALEDHLYIYASFHNQVLTN